MVPALFTYAFQTETVKARLPKLGHHDLRHHSAASTLDTYVHDTNEQQVAAAKRFASLLNG